MFKNFTKFMKLSKLKSSTPITKCIIFIPQINTFTSPETSISTLAGVGQIWEGGSVAGPMYGLLQNFFLIYDSTRRDLLHA